MLNGIRISGMESSRLIVMQYALGRNSIQCAGALIPYQDLSQLG